MKNIRLRHHRRLRPLVLAAVGAMLLATGCSTNRATGQQSFTAFMSENDEIRVGAKEHPKILEAFGGEYGGPRLKRYVNGVGKALAAVSEVPHLDYKFTILNDEKINAFALPGGFVYITRGLLALAANEAEMAAVLAHEIGHITARHSAERYSTTMATNLGLTVMGVIGSVAGLPSGLGKVISLGAEAAIKGYSRQQELEADMLGVRYMTRLGYDPKSATSFFRKMGEQAKLEALLQGRDGINHNIMSTHPRTEQRIDQAIQLAKSKPVENPIVERRSYLEQIDGIVFGDDPSQGIRKGRTFIHPDLRFKFKVPPGFILFNSPSRVQATGPEKSRIIFDMADPKTVRANGGMASYLQNKWGAPVSLGNIDHLEINGMPAVTGTGVIKTRQGRRDVRLMVIRGGRDEYFRFAFLTPPKQTAALSTELRRTTYSFQRLSDAEASAIQPSTLRIIKVKTGDTVASLAERMPFESYKREWFRVLNGLEPGDPLIPGQQVKIIAE